MDRKLAAILAADVVGYSTLMERDEQGTFARLTACRTGIFEPVIENHHGRVFKLMGDGLLAEFASVVDAVSCAMALQAALAARNEGLAPGDRIDLRIGINLGDIIVEGTDRHGEAVNIAARLEQLADPGGICISQAVFDHLGNKLPLAFEPMGTQQVKNLQKPVIVYRVKPAGGDAAVSGAMPARRGLAAIAAASVLILILILGAVAWIRPWEAQETPAPAGQMGAGPLATGKPSLVVLPFSSLGDDKDQLYLAAGITEDLTTALARMPGLFVISNNSADDYAGRKVAPAQIAQELGVRYILEGSVRRAGDEMRINAQLVDATTSGHVWAQRFDGSWSDVFKLQDQVVSVVAESLKLQLVGGSRIAELPGGTSNADAYNFYLRGYQLNYANSPAEAAALFRQALALDPNFGSAWAELAWVYWSSIGTDAAEKALGAATYEDAVITLKQLLKEAAAHPSSTYYQLSAALLAYERKSGEAIPVAERAIALDPSDFWAYEQVARALVYNGRAADAKTYVETAWRVDPQPSSSRYLLAGLVAFSLDQFDEAIASLGKTDANDFNSFNNLQRLFLLAAAHGHLGHDAEAAKVKAELETLPNANGLRAIGNLPFQQPADIARLLTGLSKAGVPDLPFGYRWDSPERLTGEAIKQLTLGHEIRGREDDTGEPYVRSTAADGAAQIAIGDWTRSGVSTVEGDFLCSAWDTSIDTRCSVIFRNPAGTPEQQNEYVLLTSDQRVTFSVAK